MVGNRPSVGIDLEVKQAVEEADDLVLPPPSLAIQTGRKVDPEGPVSPRLPTFSAKLPSSLCPPGHRPEGFVSNRCPGCKGGVTGPGARRCPPRAHGPVCTPEAMGQPRFRPAPTAVTPSPLASWPVATCLSSTTLVDPVAGGDMLKRARDRRGLHRAALDPGGRPAAGRQMAPFHGRPHPGRQAVLDRLCQAAHRTGLRGN